MNNVLRNLGLALVAAVALSFLTNHDYLWGGIRETWLRGWENAQIDDLPLTFVRPSPPRPATTLAGGPLWKAVLWKKPSNGMPTTRRPVFGHQHDSLVHESYCRGRHTTLTNAFSMTDASRHWRWVLRWVKEMWMKMPVGEVPPPFGGAERGSDRPQVLHMRSNIPFGRATRTLWVPAKAITAMATARFSNRTACRGSWRSFRIPRWEHHALSEMLDRVRGAA